MAKQEMRAGAFFAEELVRHAKKLLTPWKFFTGEDPEFEWHWTRKGWRARAGPFVLFVRRKGSGWNLYTNGQEYELQSLDINEAKVEAGYRVLAFLNGLVVCVNGWVARLEEHNQLHEDMRGPPPWERKDGGEG
jgi:hypothetical protein